MKFIQPTKMQIILTTKDKQIMADYFNLFLDYCNNAQANMIICDDCPVYDVCPINPNTTRTEYEFITFICNQIKASEEHIVIEEF